MVKALGLGYRRGLGRLGDQSGGTNAVWLSNKVEPGGGILATRATIVLADDDDDLRAIYTQSLQSAGHTILEARNGLEAVQLVRKHRPALLLLDLWMPDMDGLQVLEALRHDPAADQLKVVMFSIQNDADSRLESFGIGAIDYMIKGMPLAEVRDRIEGFLNETGALLDSAS